MEPWNLISDLKMSMLYFPLGTIMGTSVIYMMESPADSPILASFKTSEWI